MYLQIIFETYLEYLQTYQITRFERKARKFKSFGRTIKKGVSAEPSVRFGSVFEKRFGVSAEPQKAVSVVH